MSIMCWIAGRITAGSFDNSKITRAKKATLAQAAVFLKEEPHGLWRKDRKKPTKLKRL